MSKKLNAVIGDEIMEKLDKIAISEKRTRSQMADILLAEAIEAREKQSSKKESKSE